MIDVAARDKVVGLLAALIDSTCTQLDQEQLVVLMSCGALQICVSGECAFKIPKEPNT